MVQYTALFRLHDIGVTTSGSLPCPYQLQGLGEITRVKGDVLRQIPTLDPNPNLPTLDLGLSLPKNWVCFEIAMIQPYPRFEPDI